MPSPGAKSHVGVNPEIVWPDASVAVRLKRTTSPARTCGDAGEMVTDRTFAEITVTPNCSRAAPIVAVIVAEPGLTPVSVPSCDARTTDGAELVHMTRSSARMSPVAERTVVP